MLTKQEAFDTVAKHLFAQGRQSQAGEDNTCLYRAPGGLKCAIGALIPDDEYRPEFEGKIVLHIADTVPSLKRLNEQFLWDLQNVHDDANPWGSDDAMKAKLREVARLHRVKATILDGLSFNRIPA